MRKSNPGECVYIYIRETAKIRGMAQLNSIVVQRLARSFPRLLPLFFVRFQSLPSLFLSLFSNSLLTLFSFHRFSLLRLLTNFRPFLLSYTSLDIS